MAVAKLPIEAAPSHLTFAAAHQGIFADVVAFDIDHASRKFDLSEVETIVLPPASTAK
jgi:hypothetical protein